MRRAKWDTSNLPSEALFKVDYRSHAQTQPTSHWCFSAVWLLGLPMDKNDERSARAEPLFSTASMPSWPGHKAMIAAAIAVWCALVPSVFNAIRQLRLFVPNKE